MSRTFNRALLLSAAMLPALAGATNGYFMGGTGTKNQGMAGAGGAVRGGRLYGQYPLLEIDSPLEIGCGVFIPTMASDQYAATLASWFGVRDTDLPAVAPNVVNFSSRNVGFMT